SFFQRTGVHPHLPSFPTRRSSDLDLLRNEEKVLDRKGVQAFHGWIRQALADGTPLNEFARELIAGQGSTYAQPAANYYRALRDRSEEHTSELQSRGHLVCRLLLEK